MNVIHTGIVCTWAMTRVYNIQKHIFSIPRCVFDQQKIGFEKILKYEKSSEKFLATTYYRILYAISGPYNMSHITYCVDREHFVKNNFTEYKLFRYYIGLLTGMRFRQEW